MLNPLLDKDFLKDLDLENQKTKYVKAIALDYSENPIEEISGVVTQGNINIDGKSAVRRTCSLTLVAPEVNYNDYLWGLNTKIELQIGIENHINKNYPNIIWFKQGIYLLTSFSIAQTENNYTISLQGKDKMCLLNGEVGGVLPISIDFGTVEQKNEQGLVTKQKLKLVDIILGIVHTYGKENFENIYINDVNEKGLELLTYKGNNPLYYIIDKNSKELIYIITNIEEELNFKAENSDIVYNNIAAIPTDGEYFYEKIYNEVWSGKEFFVTENTPQNLLDKLNGATNFYIVKIEAGQTSAYKDCDLVYDGDLIANAGDTITSILDKIVKQLGNYEYFYNLDGQFIFRKKKSYINTSWNNIVSTFDEEEYTEDLVNLNAYSYSFDNQRTLNSFNLNPNFENLKNDYSIWGTRKNIYGNYDLPIHLRYAINTKPIYYKDYNAINVYISLDNENCPKEIQNYTIIPYDSVKPEFINKIFMGINYKELKLTEEDIANYIQRRVEEKEIIQDYEGEFPETDKLYYFYGLDMAIYGKNEFEDYELITADTGNKRYDKYYIKQLNENWDCNIIFCDWREIIYQMALDYNKYHLKDDFNYTLRMNNFIDKYNPIMTAPEEGYYLYPEGKTGYEQYYEDMIGFWRGLYNPKGGDIYEEINYEDIGEKKIYSTLKVRSADHYFGNFRSLQGIDLEKLYLHMYKINKITKEKENYYISFVENILIRELYTGRFAEDDYKLTYKGKFIVHKEPGIKDIKWDDIPNNPNYQDFGVVTADGIVPFTPYNLKNRLTDLVLDYFIRGFTGIYGTSPSEDKYVFIEEVTSPESILNIDNNFFKDNGSTYRIGHIGLRDEELNFSEGNIPYYIHKGYFNTKSGWNELIWKAPEKLDFWIDFLDNIGEELQQYSVSNIGSRPKVVNDVDIKSISYKEIFNVKVNDNPEDVKNSNDGYVHYFLGEGFVETNFQISTLGKTAQDTLNEFLNNYTYCTETINITAAPIYYLEPNTLITIQEEEMGIKKKYEINNISIPLAYNESMSISATRVFDTIY